MSLSYLDWTTEAIRTRCILAGFKMSYATADAIQNLLCECGVL